MGLFALAMLAGSAQAHPGHGSDGGSFSLVHYLTDPTHIVIGALILLGLAVILAKVRGKSTRARLPL